MPNEYPKYIVLAGDKVIIFTPMLGHNEIARTDADIIAAGFFTILSNGLVECFGESQSLGMKCRMGIDAMLIEHALRLGEFKEQSDGAITLVSISKEKKDKLIKLGMAFEG